jgi:hypothetical protein
MEFPVERLTQPFRLLDIAFWLDSYALRIELVF